MNEYQWTDVLDQAPKVGRTYRLYGQSGVWVCVELPGQSHDSFGEYNSNLYWKLVNKTYYIPLIGERYYREYKPYG